MNKKIIISIFVSCLFASNIAKAESVFSDIGKALKWGTAIAGGAAVLGNMSLEARTDLILSDPGHINFLRTNYPYIIQDLISYANDKIAKSQIREEINKYLQLKELLNSDFIVIDSVVINDIPTWDEVNKKVKDAIATQDAIAIAKKGYPDPGECNAFLVEQVLLNNEIADIANAAFPKKVSNPIQLFDVDLYKNSSKRYGDLPKKDKLLHRQNQDHIPSYAAIEKFVTTHGIAINPRKRNGKDGRDPILEGNTVSIAIPEEIHKKGRTFVGRNTQTQVANDALNLEEAALKDIMVNAYWLMKDNKYKNMIDKYVESAAILHAKNRMMCLYYDKQGKKP